MIAQKSKVRYAFILFVSLLLFQQNLFGLALTLTVQAPNGAPVGGYRWLLEEDTTNHTAPGVPVADSISLDIHNSYNPVVLQGHSDASVVDINDPSLAADKRYFVSVLPDAGYALGGTAVDVNQTAVSVHVHKHPIPTAQISVFVFADQNPINNVFDEHEQGIGGATIVLSEIGGQQMMDAFGNPLGTVYQQNPDGSFLLDPNDGTPLVMHMGSGVITTLTKEDFDAGNNPDHLKVGEALVKYIAPNKFGVIIVPPTLDDDGSPIQWSQTSTIEGTPTVDAWVKANEPRLFVEGFGTGFNHVFFGFVKVGPVTDSTFQGQTYPAPPWNVQEPNGTGVIEGTLRYNHFARPPMNQGYWPGDSIGEGWIALNDPLVRPGVAMEQGGPLQYAGLYAAPCDPNGHFLIRNVPAGTYQLVTWDTPLDNLFGIHSVTVGPGQHVNLGDVLEFRWFGTLQGSVFYDNGGGDPARANNGFRDPGEMGIPEQNINLRFRDGTVYQAQLTDGTGEYAFEEVFPFFKWLVAEVDFLRFKATGMTAVVDAGGEVLPHDGWTMPSYDKLTPQVQIDMDPASPTFGQELVNPHTGNALSRTETGPVLTEAMHLFLNQTNVIDWGKNSYGPGENGGISGIVFYDTTRAENDPRYGVGEPWQPGIPRVQVNLYQDTTPIDGLIDDLNGDGPTLADVDNYPFGWREDPNLFGPGIDLDRNGNGAFDAGDALQIVATDSWDDNKPTGSIGPVLTIHGQEVPVGMDAFATWNQVRPGIFDGGYAFGSYYPGGIASGSAEVEGLPTGTYIVEATTPPGYILVKEEDKNVDFGDDYVPSPQALPPLPVGDLHQVPAELSLFPGVPCEFADANRPLCDRKQVLVAPAKNTAADFFFFTEVPKAARGVGFANNDLGAEFNQWSPNFGEKISPAWIPISLRDWAGLEMHRVYTDEFGCYNFLIPSTFAINVPAPSGVAPQMMTLVLNDPIKPDGTIDEFYNPMYSITPWTFQYYPGSTSYLDTPLVPLSAFAPADVKLDTEPNNVPVIASLDGPGPEFGPVVAAGAEAVITLQSRGTALILNPAYDPNTPGSTFRISRNYGFGNVAGQVLLEGVALAINSWTDGTIEAVVPAGATTGRITVVRGDNDNPADVGVTLHVVDFATTIIRSVPAEYATIQAALDAANPGDLILVAPGTYNENVIMNKPVRLQGAGSGGTTIFGYPNPLEKLDAWHARLNDLGAREFCVFLMKDPFSENEAPGILVLGETEHPAGTLQNPLPGTLTFNAGYPFNRPGETAIDGFTISGSKAGGAVFAVTGAAHLIVSNLNATGNQGSYGGGITFGTQDSGFDCNNDNVVVRYCKVHKNGGTQGPGGLCMNEYAENYRIEHNLIWGNFSRFNGGGIGHRGLCPGDNVIQFNKILFNEDHFGALLAKAGDGGGLYIGGDVAGGTGTGNVTINGNLIQGNMTGSGMGGGIRAFAINAEDVRLAPANPDNWYTLNIFNNLIVNNVAALSGAGISLQDAARVNIVHNTVAHNDCTATAALAFTAGQANSTPQPAGLVGARHSDLLIALFDASVTQSYSNPLLRNNILWHNRSWYNDAALNGGQGGLAPRPGAPYWDLAILGSTSAADPHLAPRNSILTSLTDPATGFDYGPAANENLAADPSFVAGYENQLASATVLDEAGNNINVLILPLTIEGSDYHINTGSPATLAGDGAPVGAFAELASDYDGQVRSAAAVDIGADQISFGPAPVEVIVDNLSPGTSSTGSWFASGSPGFWATNSVATLTPGSTFTFPADLAPGTAYAVYAWWTTGSNRYTQASYQIRDGGTLVDTVTVNQFVNGGQWNPLGIYEFSGAASVRVLAAPSSTWSVNADAVRFVPVVVESLEITGPATVDENSITSYDAIAHCSGGLLVPVQPQVWTENVAEATIDATGQLTTTSVTADTPAVITAQYTLNGATVSDTHNVTILDSGALPPEVIVDNLDAGTSSTGSWFTSGSPGFWATDSLASLTPGSTFTFNADLVPGVSYNVYAWWTTGFNRYTAVPYQIRSGGTLLGTVNVNQFVNGGQWNLLGTYTFTGTAGVTVQAAPTFAFSVCADAVRFVPAGALPPVTMTVDNLTPGTTSTGSWFVSSSPNPWATNSMATLTPGSTFTFPASPAPGTTYEVYAWWTQAANRYTSVPYEIRDGATLLGTTLVNQTTNGGQWNLIGTYTFGASASVTILAAPSFAWSTCADAVQFVPVP